MPFGVKQDVLSMLFDSCIGCKGTWLLHALLFYLDVTCTSCLIVAIQQQLQIQTQQKFECLSIA